MQRHSSIFIKSTGLFKLTNAVPPDERKALVENRFGKAMPDHGF
jgi:hypothetical protein